MVASLCTTKPRRDSDGINRLVATRRVVREKTGEILKSQEALQRNTQR